MNRALFLDVNGAVRGGPRQGRWFELPDAQPALNSFRFGHHAYAAGRTMQLLPVGGGKTVAREPEASGTWRAGVRRVRSLLSSRHYGWLTLLQ